jgi:hypothetical protein
LIPLSPIQAYPAVNQLITHYGLPELCLNEE